MSLDGLINQRGADLASLEEHRLKTNLRVLGRALREIEDLLSDVGSAGDIGIEWLGPADLDDVNGCDLRLDRSCKLGDELDNPRVSGTTGQRDDGPSEDGGGIFGHRSD